VDELHDVSGRVRAAFQHFSVDLVSAPRRVRRVRVRASDDSDSVFLKIEWRGGGWTEWEVFAGDDDHLEVAIADDLSAELSEIGRPWPPCSIHPEHALQAEVKNETATWVCPATHGAVAIIGALGRA